MTENRYITKLIKAYSDYGRIHRKPRNFSSDDSSELTLDEAKIELLRRASRIFLEHYRKIGIYPEELSDDELTKNVAHVLYNVLGLCNTAISKKECEKEAEKLAKQIRSDINIYSRLQKSFSGINLGNPKLNRIGKILMSVLMPLQPLFAKMKGDKSLEGMLQTIIANHKKIEIVEKMVGRRVRTENDIIISIDQSMGNRLRTIYETFHYALGQPPKSELETTEVAKISYLSSKRVYNYVLSHNQYISIEKLSESNDEKAAEFFKEDIKNFFITAVSHHILANLHEALGLSREQVIKAIEEGVFEVQFIGKDGRVTNTFTDKMYITLRDIKTKEGTKNVSFSIRLISISLADPNIKDGSAALEKGFTNFYVKLPVGLAPNEMSGIHEVVFKIQVQINLIDNQMNTGNQVSNNRGTSNRYPKNKRLFNKKKKYNWM